jgi:transposase
MGRTLSQDLRSRVIAAVDGGMSRHAAAERFGVAVATAVRWVHVWRTTGATAARPKGGDMRSHRIEAFRDVILGAIDVELDVTLTELANLLRQDHGVSFARSTIWRFLDRQGITFKNVWPAPSASDLCDPIWSVYANVSGLGTRSRPRWRSARPGPHKTGGVGRHILNQVSRTPIDCQAILLPTRRRPSAARTGVRDRLILCATTPSRLAWRIFLRFGAPHG